MFFNVLPAKEYPVGKQKSKAFLITDNWNDFHKYNTQYTLVFYDDNGIEHVIGSVKIGQIGMKEGQRRPDLDPEFDFLPSSHFSLGQDDSYYENLNKIGHRSRKKILKALNDIAFNLEIFDRALAQATEVTDESITRDITSTAIRGQFHRMAHGGVRQTRYKFTYNAVATGGINVPPLSLDFHVEPSSRPPTNIHVLIGRNGVGKTRLLTNMAKALVSPTDRGGSTGEFLSHEKFRHNGQIFANLVSVAFSAFDPFEDVTSNRTSQGDLKYEYIGLKDAKLTINTHQDTHKGPNELAHEFSLSVAACRHGNRFARWSRIIDQFEIDPILEDAGIRALAEPIDEDRYGVEIEEVFQSQARLVFNRLSSGHKVVLYSLARLVETVEERTLVLVDEPEAYLHPPLLSMFIRALSDLLIDRNGVAIIATHSPVVLQEVPKRCSWIIQRSGIVTRASRPERETFGENVGVLTHNVFGLEVTKTGFYKMIADAVAVSDTFQDVLDNFDDELGSEAQAIAMTLLLRKQNQRDN